MIKWDEITKDNDLWKALYDTEFSAEGIKSDNWFESFMKQVHYCDYLLFTLFGGYLEKKTRV